MPSLEKYFSESRPKPKWLIGDRVFGHYNKIPFVGTVLVDHLVCEEQGPTVAVSLDLPLKYQNEYRTIVEVKQKDLKRLTTFKN